MNRSKYLADFLVKKGFIADSAGILPETKNLATQKRVNESDILIFVMPRIREKFLKQFKIGKQEIITLNVEDRLDILCPDKTGIIPADAQKIYETLVYPELRKQIAKYIPLLETQF